MNRLFISLFFIVFSLCSYAQDGSIDLSFNTSDKGVSDGSGANGDVYKTLLLNNGKILIAGSFTSYNGIAQQHIARLNVDGSLDTTFHTGSGTDGVIYTMAIQTDKKIIIGGNFNNYNGVSRKKITRLNADGTLDGTFNSGTGADSAVYAISIQNDGKIIMGGCFKTFNGKDAHCITRLISTGSRDSTFNGTGANDTVKTIVLQPDGRILIGGNFTSYNGVKKNYITRLDPSGNLDATFTGIGPIGTGACVQSMAIQSDGKIIVGGTFTAYDTTKKNCLVRIQMNGVIDTTFRPGLINANIYAIAIQNDGQIIIGGDFHNWFMKALFVRLLPGGYNDTVFSPNRNFSYIPNNTVRTIAIQNNGNIMIGGSFIKYGQYVRNHATRLTNEGFIDAAFNSCTGVDDNVRSIAVQHDKKIIIVGGFSRVNKTLKNHIARLNENGTIDTTFSTEAGTDRFIWDVAVQPDGKIIVAGDFRECNGKNVFGYARLNSDGTIDNGFDIPVFSTIYSIYQVIVQPDGKILLMGIRSVFRLNADGTRDLTFKEAVTDKGNRTIALQKDGKVILAGYFSECNGIPIRAVVRLNANGTFDSSFNSPADLNPLVYHYATTSTIQTDGKIILAGVFALKNGTDVQLIRFNTDGTVDTTFQAETKNVLDVLDIIKVILQPNKKILASVTFFLPNATTKTEVVRFNTDGSIDPTFKSEPGTDLPITAMVLQDDQKILVGGEFTICDNVGKNRIARLSNSITVSTAENAVAKNELKTYPNPFSSSTTISFTEELKNATFVMSDLLGKEVKFISFSGKQLSLERDELKPGIYTIKIVSDNRKTLYTKVVVQ
jgi:uncharacterized delta-60 repeat protein